MTDRPLDVVAPADQPTLVTRRAVAASRDRVFDAFTRPELLREWLGPHTFPVVSVENDVRIGGGWRFVHRGADGGEAAFRGVYKEIVRPERFVRSFVFEGAPGEESEETLWLEDAGSGETRIVVQSTHPSIEARDRQLRGLREGLGQMYEKLDALLSKGGTSPDPIEDVRQGLGLLFRAAKGALDRFPAKEVESAVASGAREMGRAFESVGKTIEREVFKKGDGGDKK